MTKIRNTNASSPITDFLKRGERGGDSPPELSSRAHTQRGFRQSQCFCK